MSTYIGGKGEAKDGVRTRQAIQKLSKGLGPKSVPAFGGAIYSEQIVSSLADGGLSPINVVSKVLCENLNVEYLGGHKASEFVGAGSGMVQSVLATTPVVSSGGVRPTISLITVPANLGGTGVANNVLSTLTITGNYGITLTVSGTTALTLPTAGTVVYSTAGTYAPIDNYINQAVKSDSSPSFVRLISTEPTLAPFTVASTVVVTNLNANFLQGEQASAFQDVHANLTSLSGIATTVGLVKQTSANVFGIDATAYYKSGDTILAGNGTAAAPSISFANDTDTGFWWDGTVNTMFWSCGAVGDALKLAANQFQFNVYSDTASIAPLFYFRRAKNTYAAPVAVTNSSLLMGIYAYGYSGATNGYLPATQIRAYADEAFSDTASGGRLEFWTTPKTTVAPVKMMVLESTGNVRMLYNVRIGSDVTPTVALDVVGAGIFTTSLTVGTGFGCNSKTAQTSYASGGDLAAYGAGTNGLDSGTNMSALHAMVVSIRAALVANGIMS